MLDEISALERFEQVVCTDRWTSLFPALDTLCQSEVGHRLFSCSVFRMTGAASGVAARVYTSDPENYPVSGLKEIVPNRWTAQVIERHELFVANSVGDFADVFPDHALIASLGLGSVVNLPVVFRGDFIGTVNLLHEADYYTEDRVAAVRRLALPALLSFEFSADVRAKSES
jgi:hypothetical protein